MQTSSFKSVNIFSSRLASLKLWILESSFLFDIIKRPYIRGTIDVNVLGFRYFKHIQ